MTNQQRAAWERVGEAVRKRMAELAMAQADVIRASGVSDMTVRPIRKGEPGNYQPATLAKIAHALEWEADAFDRLLAGSQPVPLASNNAEQAPAWAVQILDEMREITRIFERVAEYLDQQPGGDGPRHN